MKIIDLRQKLKVHSRKRYSLRSFKDITHIVIHHSATANASSEGIARYHVQVNGWPGIGYHYIIAKDGTVYKTNSLTTVSYHAKGVNKEAIGICLVGNFSNKAPEKIQLASLKKLVDLLKKYLPELTVVFHRDVPGARTTCPGSLFPRNWEKLVPEEDKTIP